MPHLAEMVLMLVDLSLYLIFGGGYLESMGAAPGSPHLHWTRPDAASGIWHADLPLEFIFLDSGRNRLIRLIPANTAAETGQNGQLVAILLLHVALWGEKKKMRRHKKNGWKKNKCI